MPIPRSASAGSIHESVAHRSGILRSVPGEWWPTRNENERPFRRLRASGRQTGPGNDLQERQAAEPPGSALGGWRQAVSMPPCWRSAPSPHFVHLGNHGSPKVRNQKRLHKPPPHRPSACRNHTANAGSAVSAHPAGATPPQRAAPFHGNQSRPTGHLPRVFARVGQRGKWRRFVLHSGSLLSLVLAAPAPLCKNSLMETCQEANLLKTSHATQNKSQSFPK